jgi:membrane protein
LKEIVGIFRETFKEWSQDKASRLGAAVAYYTVFSMAPLLIVVIAVAGLVFGAKATRGEIVGQLQGVVGSDSARMIQTMIASTSKPSSGIVATVIGIVTLLMGATGLFGELQGALNTIFKVAPKPRGILETMKAKYASFSMVLGVAFLLLVSLVVSAGLAAAGQLLGNVLPIPEIILQVLNFLISFGIITLLFAMMYKFLPDAEIGWREIWIGAAVTSVLFTIGQLAIGLYLGHSGTTSTYGAAGSLVVLLLWVYYSAQIFFFGAEFTRVHANRSGHPIRPKADAISLTEPVESNRTKVQDESLRPRVPT